MRTAHKPWYSRRSRRLKCGLWCTSILLVAILGALAWGASKYSMAAVMQGDDYLLMTDKQAKECKDGGGCAIFSEREFLAALSQILAQQQRQRQQKWGDI